MVEAKFVGALPYFQGLAEAEVADIASLIFERHCQPNEVVLLEGEPSQAMYAVVSGRVKIVKTSAGGKEQVLRVMRPGESFNEVPLFDGGPNPATVIALELTLLYGISQEKMGHILSRHPRVVQNVLRLFAQRLRYLVSLVEDLSFRPVTARVAKLLLEQEEQREKHTQQEMAAQVGTVREVVGRSLKGLEALGAIKMVHGRVVIVNRRLLEELVESYP